MTYCDDSSVPWPFIGPGDLEKTGQDEGGQRHERKADERKRGSSVFVGPTQREKAKTKVDCSKKECKQHRPVL